MYLALFVQHLYYLVILKLVRTMKYRTSVQLIVDYGIFCFTRREISRDYFKQRSME